MAKTLKPGSAEAVDEGCSCPVFANKFGRGPHGDNTRYITNPHCPLHYSEKSVLDIQHGVTLVKSDGSTETLSRRWRKWEVAAQAGQTEVEAGKACGFRVFEEES